MKCQTQDNKLFCSILLLLNLVNDSKQTHYEHYQNSDHGIFNHDYFKL